MNRTEAVLRLRECGYDVADDGGVLMFYGASHRDAERACMGIGYTSSFGARDKRAEKNDSDK